jgi:hypothetical protein
VEFGVRYWTPEEDQILRDLWHDTERPQILDELIDRTWESARKRATSFGLYRHPKFRCVKDKRWTAEEEQALRDLYPSSPRAEVEKAIPARNWKAIMRHANKLPVHRDISLAMSRSLNPHTEKIKLIAERKVMDFLVDYYRQWGAGPMRQEIGAATGVKNNTLTKVLGRLEAKKMIVFPQVGRRLPVYLHPGLRRKIDANMRDAA